MFSTILVYGLALVGAAAAEFTGQPISEPAIMLLFGCGLFGLAGIRRTKLPNSSFAPPVEVNDTFTGR